MTEVANNKELIPFAHYLAQYETADPVKMAQRSGFAYDEESGAFTVIYYGRPYRVTWPAFEIACLDEREDYAPLVESNQSKILVIRYLLEGNAIAPTGKFLTYRDVPWGEVYYRQFSGRCMSRLAFSYGTKPDVFRAKMEHFGAVRIPDSDAGYEFEVFPGYAVRFLLWEADEDFPPSTQILFSDNFAAAFHAEDLVVVAEAAISALKNY